MKKDFVAKYKRNQRIVTIQTKDSSYDEAVYYPIGVVVAMRNDNGVVSYGWSSCQKGDEFSKKYALELAKKRAVKGNNRPIPSSISSVVDEGFIKQIEAHFDEPVNPPRYFAMRQGKKKLMVRVGENEMELEYNPNKKEEEEEEAQ